MTPRGQRPVASPVEINDDDGDVLHAKTAFFGADLDSHVRFCRGEDGRIYLLGIWREADSEVSGSNMVGWLSGAYSASVRVVEVASTAVGFWEKMQERGLIESWTFDQIDVAAVPVEQSALADIRPGAASESITLYSTTSLANLESIIEEGLRTGSYWSSSTDIADYYRETVADEGGSPVTLQIELSSLRPEHLAPDMPGIEEPLTYTLGMTEEEVAERWQESAQTWRDSLDIIQTLRYKAPVAAELLSVKHDGAVLSLPDYLAAVPPRRWYHP